MKWPTPRARSNEPTIKPLVEVKVATTSKVNITPSLNISIGNRIANLFMAWWTKVLPKIKTYKIKGKTIHLLFIIKSLSS